MSLKAPLKKGDWVRATNKKGSVIEAQAANSSSTVGSALIQLTLDGIDSITINANQWDIEITHKNMLLY